MALRADRFRGMAPKVAPELLPEGAAQIARNCKLDSGNIIPYPELVVAGNTGRTGVTKTIYPLTNPDTGDLVWLSWAGEVDVATPAFEPVVEEQRFYYSGDGVPKVSTYALATSGAMPYPGEYYELGLPLPDEKLTTVAATFTAKTISSVARDAGGIVTFETATAHELRNGTIAAVKGFTHYAGTYSRSGNTVTVTLANHGIEAGATLFLTGTSGTMTNGAYVISNCTTNTFDFTDPVSGATSGGVKIDTRSFNTTASEVIRVDDTTFKMFMPGFEQAEYAVVGAEVELAGQTYARTYVFTWYTAWGEESVASEPSEDLVLKEGQVVTITGLPSSPPLVPARNFIRGMKLYRTLAGRRETDFYLIATLWFPQALSTVSRDGDVCTVTTVDPHHFLERDRFKIKSATNTSFNITGGIVVDVIDARTFTFLSAGAATAETAEPTGTLYHDIAEDIDDTARYWGDTTFSVTDDYNSKFLTDSLISDEWDAPPEDLEGLVVIQNNILAGFVNNRLHLSEPNQPHAWPEAYQKTLDVNIVAIKPLSGLGAVVLTERQPYILTGSDPANMTLQKVDALYPCVSKRGAVSMSFGVLYPTYEGLALYSPGAGLRLATAPLYNSDTWVAAFDPTTFIGVYYDNAYFCGHSGGSFVYEYNPQEGGQFVECDAAFTATYNDAKSGAVYLAIGTDGNVYQWDNPAQPTQMVTWKSKLLYADDYANLGAARIRASFAGLSEVISEVEDIVSTSELVMGAPLGLTFTLWADGTQVYTHEVYSDDIFRLPRGYKADTYEFQIEADIRVRAVHLGQTPLSLKGV
jgi:hypothetical protein